MRPVVTRYLLTILSTTRAGTISLRNEPELRTVVETLDALLVGNLSRVGDILAQRFKALETSIADGQWAIARHFEIIPESDASMVTYAEREHAVRLELRERKLREQLLHRPLPNPSGG